MTVLMIKMLLAQFPAVFKQPFARRSHVIAPSYSLAMYGAFKFSFIYHGSK